MVQSISTRVLSLAENYSKNKLKKKNLSTPHSELHSHCMLKLYGFVVRRLYMTTNDMNLNMKLGSTLAAYCLSTCFVYKITKIITKLVFPL